MTEEENDIWPHESYSQQDYIEQAEWMDRAGYSRSANMLRSIAHLASQPEQDSGLTEAYLLGMHNGRNNQSTSAYERAVIEQAMVTECVSIEGRDPTDIIRDIISWHVDMDRGTRNVEQPMDDIDKAVRALASPSAPRVGVPEVVREVMAEVDRAIAKFPTWPTDPLHALGVLGEEFGELGKAVLQQVYEPHKNDKGEVRKEAVQTAAMAVRFLASIEDYRFQQRDQHEQQSLAAAPGVDRGH